MNYLNSPIFSVCLALVSAFAAPAAAQRTIAHDTLSDSTPTAIQCGFCAGERYGAVFRELPAPARGLDATDFPIELRSLQIAVANARGVRGSCEAASETGRADVHLRVFTGTEAPSGDISALPTDTPWPGETLIYENPETPLQRSGSSTGTADGYEVDFNRLVIVDEMERPIRVEAPNTYLRVEVTIGEGEAAMTDGCPSPNAPPNLMPLLDRDGTIAPERNFIYAGGIGYLWNQSRLFDIMGDWAIRLEINAMGPGPGPMDGGVPIDGGGMVDGGGSVDAAPPGSEPSVGAEPADEAGVGSGGDSDGGCGCTVIAHNAPTPLASSLFGFLLITLLLRRRLSPC